MVSEATIVAVAFRLLSANGTVDATAASALTSGTPSSISAAARPRPAAGTAATPTAAVPVAQISSPTSTPSRYGRSPSGSAPSSTIGANATGASAAGPASPNRPVRESGQRRPSQRP